MGTPRERMVRLLSLLQTGRRWTAAELATAIDATPRTLRRDIEYLRGQGYPVESARGPGGHYRLVAGSALPPLMLEDDEAVAAVLGLRLVAAGGSGLDFQSEAADRAIAKFRRILPASLRRRADHVLSAVEVDTTGHPQATAETMRVLAEAITAHQRVTFDYTLRGKTLSRTVEPYRIVRVKGRWYLFCWDTGRADWRTFRLDRVSTPTPMSGVFRPRSLPAEEVADYLARQFGKSPSRRVVLTLHADVREAASRLHRIEGTLEPVDSTSCRYVAHVDSPEWLTTVLILSGLDFTIEEPGEFSAYIAEAGQRLLAAVHPPPLSGGRAERR